MADKMMRIAGRSPNGTAQAISVLQDDGGNYVLRVVDAAPFIVEISKYDTPTHSNKSIGVASTNVLPENENRKYALIVNNSDSEIYLSLGATAVLSTGILLLSKGSCYEISAMQGNLYTGAINAIHGNTGTKQLLVTEGV